MASEPGKQVHKNGKIKKKNGDGKSGTLDDENGREVIWIDRNAELKDINERDDVEYLEHTFDGVFIGTDLQKI